MVGICRWNPKLKRWNTQFIIYDLYKASFLCCMAVDSHALWVQVVNCTGIRFMRREKGRPKSFKVDAVHSFSCSWLEGLFDTPLLPAGI